VALVTVLLVSINLALRVAIAGTARSYLANPPTYQQIQSLSHELAEERKKSASYERQVRTYQEKIKWQDFDLQQAQRQIDKLEMRVSKLKSAVGGLRRPFNLHEKAFEKGLSSASLVYDGYQFGTPSERSQKSQAVRRAVGGILSAAGGSKFKAAEIIAKILKHPKLEDALDDDGSSPAEKDIQDTIVAERLKSLAKLKHCRANSEKWHAYNYILHAVVPAQCKHPDRWARFLGSKWHKMKQVSHNKGLIEAEGDWGVGHVVKMRKDAFTQQYREYLPRIEEWWTSGGAQTQTSAFVMLDKHKKGNHTINKELHCQECTDPVLCVSHAAVWQMSDDKAMHEKFCEDEPDIGAVCKFQVLYSEGAMLSCRRRHAPPLSCPTATATARRVVILGRGLLMYRHIGLLVQVAGSWQAKISTCRINKHANSAPS
jgi:hypothetical protein